MRRIDIRLRSLVLTSALVIVIALLVIYWPESLSNMPRDESGARDGKGAEISQLFDQAVEKLRHRKYQEAIEGFRAVLSHSGPMPEAYINTGFAYYEMQQYELAVEAFQTAIDLRPSQVNAYWGLAVSLEALCDIPGAIGAMRTYVHLAEPGSAYIKRANSALWEWEQLKTKHRQDIADTPELDCQYQNV